MNKIFKTKKSRNIFIIILSFVLLFGAIFGIMAMFNKDESKLEEINPTYAVGSPLGTLNSNDKSTVYGALNTIIKSLQTQHPNVFIFLMTPFGMSQERIDRASADYSLTDIVNAVIRVGKLHKIPVLYLYNLADYRKTEMLIMTAYTPLKLIWKTKQLL